MSRTKESLTIIDDELLKPYRIKYDGTTYTVLFDRELKESKNNQKIKVETVSFKTKLGEALEEVCKLKVFNMHKRDIDTRLETITLTKFIKSYKEEHDKFVKMFGQL